MMKTYVWALILPLTAVALAPSATQLDVGRRQFLTAVVASTGAASGVLANTSPSGAFDVGGKLVFGDEEIMSKKAHGTSEQPVQSDLLYEVDVSLADKICNFNRHFAERAGYFRYTNWEDIVLASDQPVTFYDSVTGKPLFQAPIGRSKESFVEESRVHGWPSFRDSEVVWENVRVLSNSGETVSVSGTHLGHNLPDRRGNRYCINLVSIAGKPWASSA
eukprot:CAMPEP_0168833772 /NCGR_PEP_ID=MMETSP0727-20121128/3241_1 /TAXON_ID=265536 /ORGANISM="Amphiprora sp., Strain CCMP467" /LENGTH=218 /DNA_ID=CAMNT_0008887089 /DNA_START=43 /DNA_END=699 /DNA_ORIENTATION=+